MDYNTIDPETMRETLAAFCDQVEANSAIDCADELLFRLCLLSARELQWRIPLSAVRQGDLPEEFGPVARDRRAPADHIEEQHDAVFNFPEN